VVTVKLSKNQWQVSFDQELMNQSAKISGNWTSDLSDGGALKAPITDEFEKGAFLLTMGRNSGIDNSYKEYLPNSSQMDKVTVQLNSKKTSGNTSGSCQNLERSCPPKPIQTGVISVRQKNGYFWGD